MAIVKQAYEYKDVYVSLIAYLNNLAQRIATKYSIDKPTVTNLDAVSDRAQLPEGDIIFITDWTLSVDGNQYGDVHNLMIGFSVINDPMLMRMETMYMNELMLDISQRKPCRKSVDIMKENGTSQVGVLVFSDDYETMSPRVSNSRTFKSVMVTMLSPQRLLAETGGATG